MHPSVHPTIDSLIYTWCQFKVASSTVPQMHVSGLWEEARVPGDNPSRQRGNMQTLHRKTAGGLEPRTVLPCQLLNGTLWYSCTRTLRFWFIHSVWVLH